MKPCARCNGSGTEPDPVTEAARELAAEIGAIPLGDDLRDRLAAAAMKLRDAARDRLGQREALLDEILGKYFAGAPEAAADQEHRQQEGTYPTHWIAQVPVADIQSWRERRQA